MTTGTKVFLAVFALIVGVMVLYYGVLMPSGGDAAVAPQSAMATNLSEPEASAVLEPSSPNRDEPEVPLILPDDPTPTKAAAFGASHSQTPTSAVSSLPVGLDPTSMLPLMSVDESPTATPEEEPEPTVAEDKAVDPAPVRSNTPVTIGPPTIVHERRVTAPSSTPQTKPGSGAKPPTNATAPKTTDYIVKSGDTMMTIAKDWFGDENKWSLIAKANPWVDPARMQIGQKLQLPSKDAKPESIKAQATPEKSKTSDKSVYIVRSGDTLAKIAREFYGSVAMWERIYAANKTVIGDDPAALQVGMKLTLPKN